LPDLRSEDALPLSKLVIRREIAFKSVYWHEKLSLIVLNATFNLTTSIVIWKVRYRNTRPWFVLIFESWQRRRLS